MACLIVRGDEDHLGLKLLVDHPTRHFEPSQSGHLHIEKHHIRTEPVDGRQCLQAVSGLSDDFDAADLTEQETQLVRASCSSSTRTARRSIL